VGAQKTSDDHPPSDKRYEMSTTTLKIPKMLPSISCKRTPLRRKCCKKFYEPSHRLFLNTTVNLVTYELLKPIFKNLPRTSSRN
jgi:hypothetical protein